MSIELNMTLMQIEMNACRCIEFNSIKGLIKNLDILSKFLIEYDFNTTATRWLL